MVQFCGRQSTTAWVTLNSSFDSTADRLQWKASECMASKKKKIIIKKKTSPICRHIQHKLTHACAQSIKSTNFKLWTSRFFKSCLGFPAWHLLQLLFSPAKVYCTSQSSKTKAVFFSEWNSKLNTLRVVTCIFFFDTATMLLLVPTNDNFNSSSSPNFPLSLKLPTTLRRDKSQICKW